VCEICMSLFVAAYKKKISILERKKRACKRQIVRDFL
jgi:hypothetical protein